MAIGYLCEVVFVESESLIALGGRVNVEIVKVFVFQDVCVMVPSVVSSQPENCV